MMEAGEESVVEAGGGMVIASPGGVLSLRLLDCSDGEGKEVEGVLGQAGWAAMLRMGDIEGIEASGGFGEGDVAAPPATLTLPSLLADVDVVALGVLFHDGRVLSESSLVSVGASFSPPTQPSDKMVV